MTETYHVPTVPAATRSLVTRVAMRAEREGLTDNVLSTRMDLTAVTTGDAPLDLKKMLTVEASTLAHDIYGIRDNLNRETGRLENHFMPRCALPQEAGE